MNIDKRGGNTLKNKINKKIQETSLKFFKADVLKLLVPKKINKTAIYTVREETFTKNEFQYNQFYD